MFYLKNIEINNFRCYKSVKYGFDSNINILIGDNAAGKTSIAEAINVLGMCKSFKTTNDNELIMNGENQFYLKGVVSDENIETKIVFSITEGGKRVVVNDKPYKSLSEYLGFINIVCFSPEDLKLVKGEPKIRRRFLDSNIGQIDKYYLKELIEFNKILKERNELLKNIENISHSNELLKVYTTKLGEIGEKIINKRKKFVDMLQPYVNNNLKKISSNAEELKMIYTPSVDCDYKKQLVQNLNNDINARTTTIGPHRDDFIFEINGLNASSYGSQGQQRTVSLAIKLGLADYIKEIKKKIIVLLDDVLGELDQTRQNELLKVVNMDSQVFITTTTIQNIAPSIVEQSKIIEIKRER